MRVLIAEDSGPSRLVLERTLTKWGYQVTVCTDGTSAWEELQKPNAPRLAILDWMMPGLSGPEICRMLRLQPPEPYTYVLLLTSRSQKEDLVEGMKSGADDYLTKPFDQNELGVRIGAGVRLLELHAELVSARERLRDLAMRDSLTGVWNRRSALDMLLRERTHSIRNGASIGVLLLDIDHFKSINDTYGHTAGDAVLQETCRRLTASIRPYDFIGRYGGEEFLVVLRGCEPPALLSRADSLRRVVAETPFDADGHQITVTASFGCTVFPSEGDVQLADVIRAADEALYDAKRSGRNRVCLRVVAGVDYSEPSGVRCATSK